MSRLPVLVVCGLAVAGGCAGGRADPAENAVVASSETSVAPAVQPNATVEFVVDGDTIDVVIDDRTERVRLIGIDTPEIAHAASGTRPGNAAECFGDEARRYTDSLLAEGTPVRLERDVVARDDYGRLLAYVYRAADGVLVNYEIVRHGFAQPLTIPPNVAHAELMVEGARRAEADEAGLWAACRGT